MKSLGTIATGGRPLCIALADTIPSWTGLPLDTDESLSSDEGSMFSTLISEDGVRFALLRPTSGSYEVLASSEEIALVEILEAPEGYNLENGLLDYDGINVEANVLVLNGFGGPVVLFDSSRPGDELDDGPSAWSEPDERPASSPPADVLRLEVASGKWSVSLFEIEQPELRLTGAWLQREESAA